jgi:uncharacterized protein (TIGR02594 family)
MSYNFLQTVGLLPKMVQEGLKLMGTAEIPGPQSNPVILAWADELGLDHIYVNDDTAWCGLFVAKVATAAGKPAVVKPLWARNWAKWGVQADRPKLGDVLVFERGSGGHVGLYIAEDATTFHVLGGNQGNTVSITRINKARLLAARRPEYKNQPETVQAYVVSSAGTISSNEA